MQTADQFMTRSRQPVLALDVSPDDRTVVIGQLADPSSRSGLSLWSFPQRTMQSTLVEDGSSLAARFSPSGQLLAYADGDQSLVVLERISKGRKRVTFPLAFVKWLSFASKQDRLVAGGASTQVWDAERDAVVWTLPKDPLPARPDISPPCCALSPDGNRLAASGVVDATIVIYDLASNEIVARIEHTMQAARSIAFDPSGTYLAAVSMTGGAGAWKVATGEALLPKVLNMNVDYYWTVRFHPDGRRVGFGLWSGFVELFDLVSGIETLKQAQPAHHGTVRDLAFTSEGQRMLSGGDDAIIRVWNLT